MKIGFIVGRDDEIYNDDWLYSITPKKYLDEAGEAVEALTKKLKEFEDYLKENKIAN